MPHAPPHHSRLALVDREWASIVTGHISGKPQSVLSIFPHDLPRYIKTPEHATEAIKLLKMVQRPKAAARHAIEATVIHDSMCAYGFECARLLLPAPVTLLLA
jgi:hypothetical protein